MTTTTMTYTALDRLRRDALVGDLAACQELGRALTRTGKGIRLFVMMKPLFKRRAHTGRISGWIARALALTECGYIYAHPHEWAAGDDTDGPRINAQVASGEADKFIEKLTQDGRVWGRPYLEESKVWQYASSLKVWGIEQLKGCDWYHERSDDPYVALKGRVRMAMMWVHLECAFEGRVTEHADMWAGYAKMVEPRHMVSFVRIRDLAARARARYLVGPQ